MVFTLVFLNFEKGAIALLVPRAIDGRGWGRASLCGVVGHVSRCGWIGFRQLVYPLGVITLYKEGS